VFSFLEYKMMDQAQKSVVLIDLAVWEHWELCAEQSIGTRDRGGNTRMKTDLAWQGSHQRTEKCMQNFRRKTSREDLGIGGRIIVKSTLDT
jgi:hypothetical protein